jgi:hypothetical protein
MQTQKSRRDDTLLTVSFSFAIAKISVIGRRLQQNNPENKVLSLRDFLTATAFRMLKHTVNKVSSLWDFLSSSYFRMLKHTVNKVSSLRDF